MADEPLLVLFKLPAVPFLDKNVAVLSFLSPKDHEYFRKNTPLQSVIIEASTVSQKIRDEAVLVYQELIARIASTPCAERTLRQKLSKNEVVSPWWYNKVSEKDNEADDSFELILHSLIIQHTADEHKIQKIKIIGCKWQLPKVLENRYQISVENETKPDRAAIVKGLVTRISFCLKSLREQLQIAQLALPAKKQLAVVYQGFWNWSVTYKDGLIKDSYFKALPEKLAIDKKDQGFMAWFAPIKSKLNCETKLALDQAKEALDGGENVVILQKFLTYFDIIASCFNFNILIKYLNYRRSPGFRELFIDRESGLDYWAVIQPKIALNFANYTGSYFNLVELSVARAFDRYKPQVAICFLEFLIYGRAYYFGAKKGHPNSILMTIQHASYNFEKLFGIVDPKREFMGLPDHYAVPKPDYLMAMGQLGADVFASCGFEKSQIFLTGSPRYDYVRKKRSPIRSIHSTDIIVLIVCSLSIDHEIEMIEAVALASELLPNLKLVVRSHPYANMANHPEFGRFKDRLTISTSDLEADIYHADLVVFSYSTLAEEALLLGKPIIQWQGIGFNGSVFRDIGGIKSVNTSDQLRQSFEEFLRNPSLYYPSNDFTDLVEHMCFFKADGLNSERVAANIRALMN